VDHEHVFRIWVYLSASPLLGLTLTLLAYLVAYRIHERGGGNPLLNPVALAFALLIGFLALTATPYGAYFEGAQVVHFLLGPATVALAIPLNRQLGKLRSLLLPIAVALPVGWRPRSAPWLSPRRWVRAVRPCCRWPLSR
jgi:putative effector of murein hydrolase